MNSPYYSNNINNNMNSAIPQKTTLKVVLIGDSGVGKTSLLNRYSTGKFTGQYKATIGADFMTQTVVVNDPTLMGQQQTVVQLQLWDTAGQERFQSLGMAFYRGADAALLVYDTTDVASLEHLDHWHSEFLHQLGTSSDLQQSALGPVPFPFCVVGNKCDKTADRTVPTARAVDWCQRRGQLMHLETSAKTAQNVPEAFEELARRALQYRHYKRQTQPQLFVPPVTPPIDLRPAPPSSSSSNKEPCC